MLIADFYYLFYVGAVEIVCRVRTHIKIAYSEIDGVGPSLYSSRKRLEVSGRRHYLQFLHLFLNFIYNHAASGQFI